MTVQVPLVYSAVDEASKEPSYYYVFPRDNGPQTNVVHPEYPIDLHDARDINPTLDLHGFTFARSGSLKSRDLSFWDHDDVVQAEYYKEIETLLYNMLPIKSVFLFDHTIRRTDPTGQRPDLPGQRTPVPRIHVDQSANSAIARVRQHCPEDADALLLRRFQIINVWRPTTPVVHDFPLAFADASTVDMEADLFPVARIAPDRVGETLGVKYNPKHKWYYLHEQTTNQATLIKCYDSEPGVACMTPHTAFKMPKEKLPADYEPRQSIEVRALCFY